MNFFFLNKSIIYILLLFGTSLHLFLGCSKSSDNKSNTNLFHRISSDSSQIKFNYQGELLYPGDVSGLYSNIAGVAAGDINNDGLPDLFFSGGGQNSKLYLNKGNLVFEDITERAGINDKGMNKADNQGVNMVDVNGDGWLDIYICKTGLEGNFAKKEFNKVGANLLYINKGNLKFEENASKYGLDIIGLSHTANFFDYDADGDLDVYVIQTGEPGSTFSFSYYESQPMTKWLSDRFFENKNGKFIDVTEKVGIPLKRSIGLSVAVADVDLNGFQDIYVANDFFGPDFFYLNNGKGQFEDAKKDYLSKTPMSSMGSDFADYNNDLYPDLFVGEMMPVGHKRQKTNLVPFSIEIYEKLQKMGHAQYPRNMLFENQAGKKLKDVGLQQRIHATEWSWSSFFFDADNDGLKDLFVANGILKDLTNMDFVKDNVGDNYTSIADPKTKSKMKVSQAPSTKTQNFLFKNSGGNFEDFSLKWGLKDKAHVRGATTADLDNDGDLDLILTQIDDSPILYENNAERLNQNFLKVRLVGPESNTFGVGALVQLYTPGLCQQNYVSTQRGFQSSPEPIVHFGWEGKKPIDSLVVIWPGGKAEVFNHLKKNRIDTILYGSGKSIIWPMKLSSTLFREKYIPKQPKHKENSFNDFKQQRLLIRKYSLAGPCLAVGDLDGSGTDDLILGAASGQNLKIHYNFLGLNSSTIELPVNDGFENAAILLVDINSDDHLDILIANGSNESRENERQKFIFLNDGRGIFSADSKNVISGSDCTSTINAADFDKDGDTDIFIGSNIVPGDYSQIPKSAILENHNGKLINATNTLIPELDSLGRIQSALWTDADMDGRLDLMVAGEWMPLHIFYQKENKTFVKKTVPNSNGWWNSIAGGDFDNDGDIDYILGNHGLNSIFQASKDKPISLVIADFDDNQVNDPVVFHYADDKNVPFVNRDLFTSHMPKLNNKYYSFEAYAKANIDSILDDKTRKTASISKVSELKSCVFLNVGDSEFKKIPLPNEAQSAPVYGILGMDLNDDAFLDLILTGNDCSNHYEYGCIDALGGRVLLGNGDGSFKTVSRSNAGINIMNEGRALSFTKDKKGKIHILTANNNGPLQVFELQRNTKSIDVPKEATAAILQFSDGQKRLVEFYIGQGYRSQTPEVLVLPRKIEKIEFFRGKVKLIDQ